MRTSSVIRKLLVLLVPILATLPAEAQNDLPSELRGQIDKLALDALSKNGVPSASIAIVKDGQIAYVKAYGNARLEPRTPATSEMRYSIGSISKQFTAAAILLLRDQGKLSLDWKVASFIPNLTRSSEVTIRQLLSHTSGYQDYWPQDYVIPIMLQPFAPQKILEMWARKPLDFDPGTKWQYSNTNYVIAGLIAERASGMSFMQFLRDNILRPLDIKNVVDIDAEKLGEGDSIGYVRRALGPLRPAPKEGKGWLFAVAQLAMPAQELAKWDISIMNQKLLKPTSYTELQTEVLLKNGLSTRYGLGVSIGSEAGHRVISHGGEVSGFTAQNTVYPDDRAAIVVLTNQDAVSAAGAITRGIAPLLLSQDDTAGPHKLEQARKIFAGLQKGSIDRSMFTDNANSYFSEQALEDFASSLAPLGTPQEFVQLDQSRRGGMVRRTYRLRFGDRTLRAWTFEMPDGRLEQYQIAPQN
jgi:D-alanyl-D-alanine carboxypeptidase